MGMQESAILAWERNTALFSFNNMKHNRDKRNIRRKIKKWNIIQ